jgi:hydrogenase expression/formation protein HypC
MCLAVPSKIIAMQGQMATIDVSGIRQEVSLLLLPEAAAIGDYVLVHAGFAIHKIDEAAAADTLNLLQEIAQADEF